MFDVSFSELMVVAVVALLVIGPEKLPKVARTLGAFAGRMQRYVAQAKEEINREVRFEELQQLQQEIKQSVEQQSSAVKASFRHPTDTTKPEQGSMLANEPAKMPAKRSTKKSTSVISTNSAKKKTIFESPKNTSEPSLLVTPALTKPALNVAPLNETPLAESPLVKPPLLEPDK